MTEIVSNFSVYFATNCNGEGEGTTDTNFNTSPSQLSIKINGLCHGTGEILLQDRSSLETTEIVLPLIINLELSSSTEPTGPLSLLLMEGVVSESVPHIDIVSDLILKKKYIW